MWNSIVVAVEDEELALYALTVLQQLSATMVQPLIAVALYMDEMGKVLISPMKCKGKEESQLLLEVVNEQKLLPMLSPGNALIFVATRDGTATAGSGQMADSNDINSAFQTVDDAYFTLRDFFHNGQ